MRIREWAECSRHWAVDSGPVHRPTPPPCRHLSAHPRTRPEGPPIRGPLSTPRSQVSDYTRTCQQVACRVGPGSPPSATAGIAVSWVGGRGGWVVGIREWAGGSWHSGGGPCTVRRRPLPPSPSASPDTGRKARRSGAYSRPGGRRSRTILGPVSELRVEWVPALRLRLRPGLRFLGSGDAGAG